MLTNQELIQKHAFEWERWYDKQHGKPYSSEISMKYAFILGPLEVEAKERGITKTELMAAIALEKRRVF